MEIEKCKIRWYRICLELQRGQEILTNNKKIIIIKEEEGVPGKL